MRARGRTIGPFTWAQLESLRDRGQLAQFHELSQDRQAWMSAASLSQLFTPSGAGGESFTMADSSSATADPDAYALAGESDQRPPPGADVELAAWFFARDGTHHGPLQIGELRRMAASGQIDPHTQVWTKGMAKWVRGYQVPELGFGALAASSAGSPAAPVEDRSRYADSQPAVYQPAGTGFRCPFCQSTLPPQVKNKISTAGWVIFLVLLIACFPLCIIGLFIKEDYRQCSNCGTKLG